MSQLLYADDVILLADNAKKMMKLMELATQ